MTARFLTTRFLSMLVSAWFVVTIVFFLARLTGDPASLLLPDIATDEEIAEFRSRYGFDDPLIVQYGRFLGRALQGDFGQSIRHMEPAFQAVLRYMPATIELALASIAVATLLGISIGVIAATRPGSAFDAFVMGVAVLGQSMPVFWQGLMAMLVFGVVLGWLPISGRGDLSHLVLPALTLGTTQMAAFARLARAGTLEQLRQDYVRTARSRGVREIVVLWRHVLPNAAIPLVTQIGLSFGGLLAGSVITETIFAWPGVGRFALQAVYNRDFPVVQATVFLVAMIFLVINFVVDVVYTWLDPRTQLSA